MDWDQYAEVIGARIRQLRKIHKLTIEKLADAAGVGAVYLGSVERGAENPSAKVLVALAEALGVSLSQLVDVESVNVKKELRARIDKAPPEEARLLLKLLDAVRGSS